MMTATFILLGIMFSFYVAMMAYSYSMLGMSQIIPSYMLAMTSIIILFFSIYKAGSVLFQMKTYEMLVALPVSPSAIVTSRLIIMYGSNLLLSIFVMLPSTIVYAYYTRPDVMFYIMTLIGTFFLPMIPITIATAIGSLIIAVSSRMKHKNLVIIVISMALTLGFIILSIKNSMEQVNVTSEIMMDLANNVSRKISQVYPPAKWYAQGVVNGNAFSFSLYILLSLVPFLGFIMLIQWKFIAISSALITSVTEKGYQKKELKVLSPSKALFWKEITRYFNSPIYVMNTLIGYFMMVAGAIAIFIMGIDKLENLMQMPGIISRMGPLLFAAMCVITTTTSSSISIEGKQWWIIKSMPVTTKQVFDAKILVNLAVAFPCYLFAESFILLAIKTSVLGYLWLICIPAVFILFISVLGITINAKFPLFNWEAEAVVVKQSGATIITMCLGFASFGLPLAIMIALGSKYDNLVFTGTFVFVAMITLLFYRENNKKSLKEIE